MLRISYQVKRDRGLDTCNDITYLFIICDNVTNPKQMGIGDNLIFPSLII